MPSGVSVSKRLWKTSGGRQNLSRHLEEPRRSQASLVRTPRAASEAESTMNGVEKAEGSQALTVLKPGSFWTAWDPRGAPPSSGPAKHRAQRGQI